MQLLKLEQKEGKEEEEKKKLNIHFMEDEDSIATEVDSSFSSLHCLSRISSYIKFTPFLLTHKKLFNKNVCCKTYTRC